VIVVAGKCDIELLEVKSRDVQIDASPNDSKDCEMPSQGGKEVADAGVKKPKFESAGAAIKTSPYVHDRWYQMTIKKAWGTWFIWSPASIWIHKSIIQC